MDTMSVLTSPIDTRVQDTQYGHKVSIPQDQPQDTQHITQETQQQTSQPGHIALDFQQHLQQQINGIVPRDMLNAAEAKQQLQNHINWFQATYGEATAGLTVVAPLEMGPSTPSQFTHPHTVPNTPQRVDRARSPKHSRSQSFQYDAAPLNQTSFGDIFNPGTLGVPLQDFTTLGAFDQQSYASSNYSSSIADPMSPPCQYNMMQTVPEDELLALDSAVIGGSANLLQSITDDQLHAPQPYSPRQAALAALGDINASIEDTGISSEQVNQYMSDQNEVDSKWTCLFPGCGKKFGRKENIRAHIQTHLGDRQFRCNNCGKCFVRQHDLKRHAKIHSGVKPNICPCGMSFARQDALTRHRQRGTCFGVLPGFEKNDDDRKKRGRPRKERPDLETRTEKANRARKMDVMNSYSSGYASACSDSGASDHSSPLTPAPSSDMDDMLFNDLIGSNVDCVPFSVQPDGTWLVDTPPTSPASYHTHPKTIAPTMLSNHASPAASTPASMDDVELALLAWRGEDQREAVY